MTEPTETDIAIDSAEPGDAAAEAPLTTDEQAQTDNSVVNPES